MRLVVRLCTDEDAAVNFWNEADAEEELPLDVLDDIVAEVYTHTHDTHARSRERERTRGARRGYHTIARIDRDREELTVPMKRNGRGRRRRRRGAVERADAAREEDR